jgi:hypothetical protein
VTVVRHHGFLCTDTFPNPTAWSIITMALFSEVRADGGMVFS